MIKIIKFRSKFLKNGEPDLMCLPLSLALKKILNKNGIKSKLIFGFIHEIECDHYWLELEDGKIIDATGSQFNGDYLLHNKPERQIYPIYIGEKPEWYLIY